jgi:putative addiction module killer protein
MIEVRESNEYRRWFEGLRDKAARSRIDVRIRRLSLGNFGDTRSLGHGLLELRIHFGPGYRVYLTRHGGKVIILLAGGDKSSQQKDVERARQLARELRGSDT